MKRWILVVCLVWISPRMIAHSGEITCESCHARTQPESTERHGVKFWANTQCYGCHTDLNQRATVGTGWNFHPLASQVFERIRLHPLSYGEAPTRVLRPSESSAMYSFNELLRFVRRPPVVRRGPERKVSSMLPFPNLSADQLAQHMQIAKHEERLPTPTATQLRQGQNLYQQYCYACHTSQSPGTDPTIFTTDYLYDYINGTRRPHHRPSMMPVLKLSRAEVTDIRSFLISDRDRKESKVDQLESELRRSTPQTSGTALTPAQFSDLDRGFWKRNHCVHCHDGNLAPADKFRATSRGVIDYVQTHNPWELWYRLETRVHEVAEGMTAKRPGMPMGKAAVSTADRDLLRRWIARSCPNSNGTTLLCPSENRRSNARFFHRIFSTRSVFE